MIQTFIWLSSLAWDIVLISTCNYLYYTLQAELITKTLKELFQVVFDKHQAEKNKDKENEEPESMENMPEEATPAAPSGLLDIGADVQEEVYLHLFLNCYDMTLTRTPCQSDDFGISHLSIFDIW